MAAGQGFKTFVTGEVLTAGDVNGYLMQGINVFTNATARDAAITAPAEGQFAFTKDNNSLWYYDGAAWVASGATGDIEGVTAGVGISGGGTSGTVTVTNSMATAIDAKGDLVPGTGADTFARLAVGANDTVLTADSAAATGLKWAAPVAIPPSAFTAKGDVLVGTASGTYVAQTVGANGTVLTANSAQADGVEWVTPAAPATNYTLVGTVGLSGTNIYTISGITGANRLLIMFDNTTVQQTSFLTLRFNGDTAQNYRYVGPNISNNGTWSLSTTSIWDNINSDSNKISIARTSIATSSRASGYLFVDGCNSSGVKTFHGAGGALQDGSSTTQYNWIGGYWNNTSTISSVSIENSTLNFSGGTMRIYKA
jgi:trimeric autotransporter adhesin